jgi:hypothetical protein
MENYSFGQNLPQVRGSPAAKMEPFQPLSSHKIETPVRTMNKSTMFSLIFSCILAVMLLIANPANAAEIVGGIREQFLGNPTVQTIQVQFPQLTAKKINSSQHLGCNCAACQDRFALIQGKLPN